MLIGFSVGCLLTAAAAVFLFHWQSPAERSAFQVEAQGSFPGFLIQNYEFAIPLNRMELTSLVRADDPDGFYGSGGAPMTIALIRIRERGEIHYFTLSGIQNCRVSDVQYLGRNLTIKNWTLAENGFVRLDFTREDSSNASAWIPVSVITGSPADDAAGERIAPDTRWLYADAYDRHFFENKSFPEFLVEFQECLRREDRQTIAGMIDFPAELSGKLYFTRSEFLRNYQKIFHPQRKKAVLKTTIKDVEFSCRGVLMPGGFFLNASQESAGPIQFMAEQDSK